MQSDEGRERLLEGVVASHRFLVGTLVGWGSGRILRHFGRSLVTSFGGGSLLILVAHNRGYATLKWNRILDDLGRRHTYDDHEATMTTTTGHSEEEEEGRERRTYDDVLLKWCGGGSFRPESGFIRDTPSLSLDSPADSSTIS
jgi:hypothetical protein